MKVELTKAQIQATRQALANWTRQASWQECVDFFGTGQSAQAAFRAYTKLTARYYGVTEERVRECGI